MNRRDFLRLAGLGLAGALFPEKIEIDMPIGDLLKKVAQGQTVSPQEAEQLRLWGNRIDLQSAFVGGLQTGQSEIDRRSFPSPINLIYSKTVSVATASIDIPIPGNFNHLWLILFGRTDGAGTANSGVNAYVNDDTASNYSHQNMSANGTTNSAQQVLSNTQFRIGYFAEGGTSAGRAGGSFCMIPKYNDTSTYKHAILLASATNTSDDTNVVADSIWNNVNPIKKLTIYAASGDNIDTGSIISVYGLL